MSVINRLGAGRTLNQRLGGNFRKMHDNVDMEIMASDARMKLIAKKRQAITDARDKLYEIGKTEDARSKLNKLKGITKITFGDQKYKLNVKNGVNMKAKIPIPLRTIHNVAIKNQNSSVQSPTRNLKTKSGVSGRTLLKGGLLTRTVSGGLKMTGNMGKKTFDNNTDRYHPLPNNPNVVTIRNDQVKPQSPPPVQRSSLSQVKKKHFTQTTASSAPSRNSVALRKKSSYQPLQKTFRGNVWDPDHAPVQMQLENKPTRLRITTANNYMNNNNNGLMNQEDWRFHSSTRAPLLKRSAANEAYGNLYSMPAAKKQALSSNIISRLDQPQIPSSSSSCKVLITNLHPVVTLDDVEELFRNIGPISYARIIREGTAEVIFFNEVDAHRSVEVYHNRQLDGQAMNVTVVSYNTPYAPLYQPVAPQYATPRPRFPPSLSNQHASLRPTGLAAASQSSYQTKSVLRTAGGSSYGPQDLALASFGDKRNQKQDIAPDLNAIHHALFSGRTSNVGSNLQVYVKVPKSTTRIPK